MGKKFACFISVRAPFGNWGFMIIRCQVCKFVLRVCLRFIWICISVCLWEVLRALHMWRLWVLFMRVYKLVCGSWQNSMTNFIEYVLYFQEFKIKSPRCSSRKTKFWRFWQPLIDARLIKLWQPFNRGSINNQKMILNNGLLDQESWKL